MQNAISLAFIAIQKSLLYKIEKVGNTFLHFSQVNFKSCSNFSALSYYSVRFLCRGKELDMMKKNINSSYFDFSSALVCSDAFPHCSFEMKCEQRSDIWKRFVNSNSSKENIKLVNIVLLLFQHCLDPFWQSEKKQKHWILAEMVPAHICWWTSEKQIRRDCWKALMNVSLCVRNENQLSVPASTAFTVMLCQPAVSRSKILPSVIAPESGSIWKIMSWSVARSIENL